MHMRLWLCLILAVGVADAYDVVRRFRFESSSVLMDPSYPYPEGVEEHHCILFVNETPVSVVGTFGRYGYFEGIFETNQQAGAHRALVNWYAAGTEREREFYGTVERPMSGAAFLTYNNGYSDVSGPMNTAGQYDSRNSWKSWNSTNGAVHSSSADAGHREDFRTNCLLVSSDYPKTMGTKADVGAMHNAPGKGARDALPGFRSSMFTSGLGEVKFCNYGKNTEADFTYVFSQEEAAGSEGMIKRGDVEFGQLRYSIRFNGIVGNGVVGTWKSLAGPRKGKSGTNIYLIQENPGNPNAAQLIGWYCNVEDGRRTECFFETYYYQTERNSCKVRGYSSFKGEVYKWWKNMFLKRREQRR